MSLFRQCFSNARRPSSGPASLATNGVSALTGVLLLLSNASFGAQPAKAAANSADLEQQCVQVLTSNAPAKDKDAACQKLKTIGTARCVPALAGLLTDEQLSHSARYVLESMPSSAAGAALVGALDKTSGQTQAGIICSVGARGEVGAVPTLGRLHREQISRRPRRQRVRLARSHPATRFKMLRPLAAQAVGPVRDAAVDGLLRHANRLVLAGGVRRPSRCIPRFTNPKRLMVSVWQLTAE